MAELTICPLSHNLIPPVDALAAAAAYAFGDFSLTAQCQLEYSLGH